MTRLPAAPIAPQAAGIQLHGPRASTASPVPTSTTSSVKIGPADGGKGGGGVVGMTCVQRFETNPVVVPVSWTSYQYGTDGRQRDHYGTTASTPLPAGVLLAESGTADGGGDPPCPRWP
jgi:hypothetical protein